MSRHSEEGVVARYCTGDTLHALTPCFHSSLSALVSPLNSPLGIHSPATKPRHLPSLPFLPSLLTLPYPIGNGTGPLAIYSVESRLRMSGHHNPTRLPGGFLPSQLRCREFNKVSLSLHEARLILTLTYIISISMRVLRAGDMTGFNSLARMYTLDEAV